MQYEEIKKQYSDSLLFFQIGDFYELFFEDAVSASSFLGITLTGRGTFEGKPIPLCGVPLHVIDHYVIKLVKGGFRVVLCDQLHTAVPGRMVERGVSRVFTPGTLVDVGMIADKDASYFAVIYPFKNSFAFAFVELLTGHVYVSTIIDASLDSVLLEIGRFQPDEIMLPSGTSLQSLYDYLVHAGYCVSVQQWNYGLLDDSFESMLSEWIAHAPLEIISFAKNNGAIKAVLCLLLYVLQRQSGEMWKRITTFFLYQSHDCLMIDSATQRSLEVVKNCFDGTDKQTLFSIIDRAATSMGSRTLKKWLLRPLMNRQKIEARQSLVSLFIATMLLREESISFLKQIGDFERLVGRIALGRARLADYCQLKTVLQHCIAMQDMLDRYKSSAISNLVQNSCICFPQLIAIIEDSLYDASSFEGRETKEWLIKEGFNAELDRLRIVVEKGDRLVLDLEAREVQKTGISSLKIRYNKVHGYAIEITNTYKNSIPAHYIRLQTLSNKERYTIQELKDIEYDRSRAALDSVVIEQALYRETQKSVDEYICSLKAAGTMLAEYDAYIGLALAAYENQFVQPRMHDGHDISITGGRHPVIAYNLKHAFIANDTMLVDAQSLLIVTGPNMGGKSTYLRQVALICILAQIGSFVPATSAELPILDRIFTRIGASDNVASGKSTFLVEMEEAALICLYATENSLVILDEVGRGTSTYDGFALAYAIVEYIFLHLRARCLFATHYHELESITHEHTAIKMYHAASIRRDDSIILLHKIIPGIAEGSFGLEVARVARLPQAIIARAQQILAGIHTSEMLSLSPSVLQPAALSSMTMQNMQPARYDEDIVRLARECEQYKKELFVYRQSIEHIKNCNCDDLTPRQALEVLWSLKEKLRD